MTFRSLRRPRQKSSAAFQEVFSRTALQTSRNAVICVLTQREAISKEILSTECKRTALIFIPPVSELSAHKLYFHHPACPDNSRLTNSTTRFVDERCKETFSDKLPTDARFFAERASEVDWDVATRHSFSIFPFSLKIMRQ